MLDYKNDDFSILTTKWDDMLQICFVFVTLEFNQFDTFSSKS